MMYSNILAMIDPGNPDGNTLQELADAVISAGGSIVNIDPASHSIEAIIPSCEISTLTEMGGVAYVRSVFSYYAPQTPATADLDLEAA